MTSELAPCPFCNYEKPTKKESKHVPGGIITCEWCGAVVSFVNKMPEQSWNQRPTAWPVGSFPWALASKRFRRKCHRVWLMMSEGDVLSYDGHMVVDMPIESVLATDWEVRE